jgi:hypothetical protein
MSQYARRKGVGWLCISLFVVDIFDQSTQLQEGSTIYELWIVTNLAALF